MEIKTSSINGMWPNRTNNNLFFLVINFINKANIFAKPAAPFPVQFSFKRVCIKLSARILL